MKKLLYVFPELAIGGAERVAIMLADELSYRYNYSISFLFFNSSEKFFQFNHKTIIYKNRLNINNSIKKIISNIILKPLFLYKHIRKNDYDFIISGYEYDAEKYLIIIKPLLVFSSVKMISGLHASLRGRKDILSIRSKYIYSLIDLLRILVFDRIILVSEFLRKEIIYKSSPKYIVINNPICKEIDMLRNENLPVSLIHEFERKKFILSISRIAPQKNLKFLINAFLRIKDKIDLDLIIIGSFSDRKLVNELNEYIENNQMINRIMILAPINNIYPLINLSTLVAVTSLYEGLSLAILEAMHLRKIIVSTPFTGHEDILNNANCFLSQDYDEQKYSELLLKASLEDEEVKKRVEQAFLDSNKYKVEIIADAYHQFYAKQFK